MNKKDENKIRRITNYFQYEERKYRLILNLKLLIVWHDLMLAGIKFHKLAPLTCKNL